MKICPKCRGFYPDNDIKCQECRLDLMDKGEYSQIYNELDKMGSKDRIKHCKEPRYEAVCKYRFSIDYDYDEKQSKFEIAEMQQRAKLRKIEKEQKEMEQNIPHCPTCGSTNVKCITTLNRAISIGIFGILSGKIGKNYECLNCKARW